MKTASISEAKNRFSAYIDMVRRGESVLITDRNKPVARLTPFSPGEPGSEEARRADLERRGVIRRASVRPGKTFLKRLPPAPRVKGDSLLRAPLADREEGR